MECVIWQREGVKNTIDGFFHIVHSSKVDIVWRIIISTLRHRMPYMIRKIFIFDSDGYILKTIL